MATTDDFHREQFDFECAECGGQECVDDQASGDRICTSCGLVAEAHAIDEHSEWRTFADSDKPGTDMNRVGGPVNHLLSDGGIGSTVIGKATKGDGGGLYQSLNRTSQTGGADRTILQASSQIGKICDRLSATKTIKDSACELFKLAMEAGIVQGRSHSATCAAAIFAACRLAGVPRSYDEITAATEKSTRKAIYKAYGKLKQAMAGNEHAKSTGHPSDYMVRYCSKLDMAGLQPKACQELIEACLPKGGQQRTGSLAGHKPWDQRNPSSVAGAVLYIIANLFQIAGKPKAVDVKIEDIGMLVHVAPGTIKSVVKDMQPDLLELLPQWVATPQQVEQMVSEGYGGGH